MGEAAAADADIVAFIDGDYSYLPSELPMVVALDMREMTYGWPTEMMVKAARRGARLVEVPMTSHPRHTGHSKVSGTLCGSLLAAWFI